ncbi:MAG: DUF4317 domain-containing protein [Lachnospiraceae bacterium]|nr:DUF4317 domain-containing protein [Lachnospiraceae bacterium]
MNKKEISEIKKQFTPENCALTRLCGCYVDGEKNKKAEMKEAFLSLPEEEAFKYFEIFRKTFSGTIGKNLLNLPFPLNTEMEGGTQDFLMKLKQSRLTDDTLLESFYDRIIENFEYGENYLILVVHGVYDIPGKASDNAEMFDASDEIYEYVLAAICPVKLSKAGLSYDAESNRFGNRTRDWLVELPLVGFLFPAFQDRSTDLHSMLYYSKNPEELKEDFMEGMFGCPVPLSAGGQKETFNALIEDTLGEDCDYEVVRNLHEKIHEMVEERKDELESVTLDKAEVKHLLAQSGVEQEKLEELEEHYERAAGQETEFLASNVLNMKKFEIKTPDVVIQVNPERSDLVETRMIDGRQCLVIAVDDRVEVNGISVKSVKTNLRQEG